MREYRWYGDQQTTQCNVVWSQCQRAFRHLHLMMYNATKTSQGVCNNFARKAVRAWFHDLITGGVDGSLLSEQHMGMNFGLCRFSQYVNALSDATGCDPGGIVAMAGFLGLNVTWSPQHRSPCRTRFDTF